MAGVARADTILAGSDLFTTSPENSWQDLSLPADFFGPGSDPFVGRVYFAGNPISPGTLGPTDTAVRRLANANVAAGDAVGVTIPIEIVALSLVSVTPITVTHGGVSPEPWNVQVCIDPTTQPQGTMTIRHEHTFGGTFVSTLPVNPTISFTRASPASTVNVNPGPITFSSAGYWSHQAYAPFDIVTTGAVVVPNPCVGLPAFNIPATSNFFAGFRIVDTLSASPTCYGKALTCEEQQLARHGILPSQRTTPPHEGVVSFSDPRCEILAPPGMGLACGASYCGDNTRPACNTCICNLSFSERFDDNWQVIYYPEQPGSLPGWYGQYATNNSQWHRDDFTTNWASPLAGAYSPPGANGSPHSARFHTAGAGLGEAGAMITPTLDFSPCSLAKFLTFYYINPNGTDLLSVYLSVNDGASYGSALVQLGAAATWTAVTVPLGADTTHTARIKIEAVSDGGTTDIGVDQVSIECGLTIPGGTYWVGDDQPTLKKLSDVAYRLNNGRLTGNVIYQLTSQYDGTAGESLPITFNPVTSNGGPWSVTIRPGPGVTMRTTSGSSATSVVRLAGADRFVLDGRAGGVGTTSVWTIANTSTAGGTGAVWVSSLGTGAGATNNTVEYLTVTCGANPQASSAETFGIASTGATLSTSNDGVDNDGNSAITRVRWGIYLRGTAANPNDNTTVTGNVVGPSGFGGNQVGRGGIVVQHQNAITIAQNEVRSVGEVVTDTAPGADAIGIGVGTNGWPPTATAVTGAVVSRNHVHDVVNEKTFSAVGIAVASTAGTSSNTVDDNQVRAVRSNGTVGGDQGVGIGIGAGNGDVVVYNSLFMTGDADPASATTATQSGVGIRITTTGAANLTLKNNAIWMGLTSNTGTLRHYAIVAPSTGYAWGSGGSDRNDYWPDPASAQATLGGIGTAVPYTPVTTLAAWQVQFTPPRDSSSLSVQPPFILPNDLHLDPRVPTPLESGGAPIPSIQYDYDAENRLVRPDIGMDEGNFIPGFIQVAAIRQMDFYGSSSPLITNTDWGSLELSIAPGADSVKRFLNLVIRMDSASPAQWVVRNIMVLAPSELADSTVLRVFFSLAGVRAAPGAIASLEYGIALAPNPYAIAPTLGLFRTQTLLDGLYDSQGILSDTTASPPQDPGPPPNPNGQAAGNNGAIIENPHECPNIEELVNECFPVAVTRSLRYLKNKRGVDLGGKTDAQLIADLKAASGWTAAKGVVGNETLLKAKLKVTKAFNMVNKFAADPSTGLNGNIITPDGVAVNKGAATKDFLRKEFLAGEDVEIIVKWNATNIQHAMTVVDLKEDENNQLKQIYVQDDPQQGHGGDKDAKTPVTFVDPANGQPATLQGLPANSVVMIISESPKAKANRNGGDIDWGGDLSDPKPIKWIAKQNETGGRFYWTCGRNSIGGTIPHPGYEPFVWSAGDGSPGNKTFHRPDDPTITDWAVVITDTDNKSSTYDGNIQHNSPWAFHPLSELPDVDFRIPSLGAQGADTTTVVYMAVDLNTYLLSNPMGFAGGAWSVGRTLSSLGLSVVHGRVNGLDGAYFATTDFMFDPNSATGWVPQDTTTWLESGTFPYPIQIVGETRRGTNLTSVDAAATPHGLSLSNRPNPFRDATEFTIGLTEASHVRLRVFDASGRWVSTLLDADRAAGRHTVTWDTRSGRGEPVKAGVYFARLETRIGRLSQRIVVLRLNGPTGR